MTAKTKPGRKKAMNSKNSKKKKSKNSKKKTAWTMTAKTKPLWLLREKGKEEEIYRYREVPKLSRPKS